MFSRRRIAYLLCAGRQERLWYRDQHNRAPLYGRETVRDIVIGMSDGLTVPFALAAGLSGAVSSTHIVITAGLAEVAAGSIAMGLGAYVAGGLIPLSPYFVFPAAHTALLVSMIVALLIFGYVKGRFTGARPIRSALQTAIVGGLAATAAFLIARAIT